MPAIKSKGLLSNREKASEGRVVGGLAEDADVVGKADDPYGPVRLLRVKVPWTRPDPKPFIRNAITVPRQAPGRYRLAR
jgi:hypothetical protein